MNLLTKHIPLALSIFACLVAPTCPQAQTTTTTTSTTTTTTNSQSDPTLVYRGIAGYADKKERDPLLSVGIVRDTGLVKILADASIAVEDLTPFPLTFEFYINRQLIATQIRSPELPGPVGINITPNIAVPPFNYAVVATLLHPNRQYTTVIYGAVEATDLSATLNCTLNVESEDATTGETVTESYKATGVPITQTGNSSFSLSFTGAQSADATETASLTGALTLSSDADGEQPLTGSLTITANGTTQTPDVTGTATIANSSISSFEAQNADESVALSCK